MQNPYKSLAAKLIVEDILGKDGWAGKARFTSSGSEANEESYYSETIHGRTIYYKQRVLISRRLRSAHYPLYPIKGVGIVPTISALILKPFAQLCADESLSAALTSQQTPLSETTPQMFC
jgi:hypothetical protein